MERLGLIAGTGIAAAASALFCFCAVSAPVRDASLGFALDSFECLLLASALLYGAMRKKL